MNAILKILKIFTSLALKYQVVIKNIGVQLICAYVFLFICKNGVNKYDYCI